MIDYAAELMGMYRAIAPEDEPDGPRAAKRRRIVEAAARLFSHYGYRKTSIEDVAREAAVAKGTVYLYYTTKAELLAHALLLEQQERFEQLKSLFERDIDPRSRLVETLRIHLLSFRRMPIHARLMDNARDMVEALAESETIEHLQHNETNIRLLASLIDDACPGRFTSEQLVERASMLRAGVTGFGLLKDTSVDGLSTERLADLFAETLVEGLTGGINHAGTPRKEQP